MATYDNPCIEYYPSGRKVTMQAAGAITGKRFLKVSADRANDLIQVVQCTAAAKAVAVAANDAASGETLATFGVGFIVPVTAGGTVVAGTEVECDSSGRAVALASGKACGYCVSGATSGNDAQIRLY